MDVQDGQVPVQVPMKPSGRVPGLWRRKALLIVGVVLIAIGASIVMLALLYPNEFSLLVSAVTSAGNSPLQNKTFTASGVSFNYPANWVSVNLSIFSSLFPTNKSTANSTRFGNESEVGLVIPASELTDFIADGPNLLSQYLSSPSNFSVPPFLSFVASGAISVLRTRFSLSYSITEDVPNAVISNTTVGGYKGVYVSFSNKTILNIKEAFAELAISEVDGDVCFVFGLAGEQKDVVSVNQSFDRALSSITCNFGKLNAAIPSVLLDKLLSILG